MFKIIWQINKKALSLCNKTKIKIMITEKQQSKIIKKALGNDRGLFIAVITETPHPATSTEVELDGVNYYVTLTHGDFACIYLK